MLGKSECIVHCGAKLMPDDLQPNEPVWSHSCQYCGAEFVTAGAKNSHENSCSENPKNK